MRPEASRTLPLLHIRSAKEKPFCSIQSTTRWYVRYERIDRRNDVVLLVQAC
jgi:hypothetical protein